MGKLLFYCILAILCPVLTIRAQININIYGTVINPSGQPVAGVTVAVKGSSAATITNDLGRFILQDQPPDAILILTSIGFKRQTISLRRRDKITITLVEATNELDGAVVTGYGSTSKRYNTGNIGKVTSDEIARIPASNPLNALQGRVAGLEINQTNGLPGSAFNVLIRGKSSLNSGTQPLYVVDGVPFMQNLNQSQLLTAMATNPLNSINPGDIESIEVLKDADATAIYGSQGANGVILITTKKGVAGLAKVDVSYSTGIGGITRTAKPLDTKTYLDMRKAAFASDGVSPTASNAPDLLIWDSTGHTDWRHELSGGTARTQNLQASLSGGNAGTRFLLSGNYNGQTTVFPQSNPTMRGGGYFTLGHSPAGGRFKVQLNTGYSVFAIDGPVTDLYAATWLPPNAPSLYDSAGKINWAGWDGIENPAAQLARRYKSETYTLNTHLVLEWRMRPDLWLKTSTGYNQVRADERRSSPILSKRPSTTARGEADWQDGYLKNWIIEPQADYRGTFGKLRAELTAGLSVQRRRQETFTTSGKQYTDDDLLGSPLAAGQLSAGYNSSEYRYMAVFGRAALRWDDRYILSLKGRRDGSSRFGPSSRFASFGAIGAGWVISEEPFIKKALPFISYAKLRGSYGVTGNDQIGDYAFLDSWGTPVTGQYQGAATLAPNSLFNPYLRWERTSKLETAVEVGMMDDRMLVSAAWYRHRGGNQLAGYALPSQTGFLSMSANLDALLENSGWELELTSKTLKGPGLEWQTSLNLTIPNSRLIRYPGLETSPDRYTHMLGSPLGTVFGYRYLGVSGQTGLYRFEDANKDGVTGLNDWSAVGAVRQRFFGGLRNLFNYKGWQLEVFVHFVSQRGRNWLATFPTVPGNLGNQPAYANAIEAQRYTASMSGAAYQAYLDLQRSSAVLTDASYVRLKNLSLAYSIPPRMLGRLRLSRLDLFVQGQNLLTVTGYKGADPETQNMLALPPARMAVIGITAGL